jgi:hypothetical protein
MGRLEIGAEESQTFNFWTDYSYSSPKVMTFVILHFKIREFTW